MTRTNPLQHSAADPTSRTDLEDTAQVSILSTALGLPVTNLEIIGGSRNSQVYKVTCGDSKTYAAKFYFHHPAGDRRRLDAEYSGLQFMWENGLRCIPKPIVADRQNGCGVYEYIEGEKILSDRVTGAEVDIAVDFLVKLKELRNCANSDDLPWAAEACFSVQSIIDNIQSRFDRLVSLGNGSNGYGALHTFLADDFAPLFEEVTGWCKEKLQSDGLHLAADLPAGSRTLSPSDFGFHNSLRRKYSEIVFLDFEYFGWDDPAKMISDFILHPASDLDETLKRRFTDNIIGEFKDSPDLAQRVETVYPLFGLKWCLIILNEFLPEDTLRRGFVGKSGDDEVGVRADCLERASTMLSRISREYQKFLVS